MLEDSYAWSDGSLLSSLPTSSWTVEKETFADQVVL